MDALCKCTFIIIETIVNIEQEETCFKGYRYFSKNLFMSIRRMKKIKKCQVPITSLSLH